LIVDEFNVAACGVCIEEKRSCSGSRKQTCEVTGRITGEDFDRVSFGWEFV
jgi:hypothetical protein